MPADEPPLMKGMDYYYFFFTSYRTHVIPLEARILAIKKRAETHALTKKHGEPVSRWCQGRRGDWQTE